MSADDELDKLLPPVVPDMVPIIEAQITMTEDAQDQLDLVTAAESLTGIIRAAGWLRQQTCYLVSLHARCERILERHEPASTARRRAASTGRRTRGDDLLGMPPDPEA